MIFTHKDGMNEEKGSSWFLNYRKGEAHAFLQKKIVWYREEDLKAPHTAPFDDMDFINRPCYF